MKATEDLISQFEDSHKVVLVDTIINKSFAKISDYLTDYKSQNYKRVAYIHNGKQLVIEQKRLYKRSSTGFYVVAEVKGSTVYLESKIGYLEQPKLTSRVNKPLKIMIGRLVKRNIKISA